jgi:hypothetical protein
VLLRTTCSSRIGGCTFAEDPEQDCTSVLPLWSAAMDPRVLAARVVSSDGHGLRTLDTPGATIHRAIGRLHEYLAIDNGGVPVRLDVTEGRMTPGPVVMRFDVADDDRLPLQLEAIGTVAGLWRQRPLSRLTNRLLALRAFDARQAGEGLRSIAGHLLGQGDWPGDGEHRKSLVRRLCAAGEKMVINGPRAVFIERHRTVRSLNQPFL